MSGSRCPGWAGTQDLGSDASSLSTLSVILAEQELGGRRGTSDSAALALGTVSCSRSVKRSHTGTQGPRRKQVGRQQQGLLASTPAGPQRQFTPSSRAAQPRCALCLCLPKQGGPCPGWWQGGGTVSLGTGRPTWIPRGGQIRASSCQHPKGKGSRCWWTGRHAWMLDQYFRDYTSGMGAVW